MSDDRQRNPYDPLRETHRQVAEEQDRQHQEPQAGAKDNSPEARLAAFEAELAEKLRTGRITPADMAYELRRFDNALVVEMNIEVAQRAREAEGAARAEPERSSEEHGDQPQRSKENETEVVDREVADRGEATDARTARLARLRDAADEITRRENDRDGLDPGRSSGDRSR